MVRGVVPIVCVDVVCCGVLSVCVDVLGFGLAHVIVVWFVV